MANIDPLSFETLLDSTGAVAASAKIYYYETGTTTPKAVYSNAALSSAISQPVTASSLGIVPIVYMSAGRYKRAVTTSADVTLSAYAADPIDASVEMITASSAPSPTYPFLRYYNTGDGHVYERKSDDSGWTDLGPVDSIGNAATVTQQLTGTSTAVYSTPDSVAGLWQRGTDISSASTLSLPSTGGYHFNVTGTTTITAISSAQGGREIELKFASALTFTHNATSLILFGGANITTEAQMKIRLVNEAAADASGSNWRMYSGTYADGTPITIATLAATQAEMETATSVVKIATPGRVHFHPGFAKARLNYNGTGTPAIREDYGVASLADVASGVQTPTYDTAFSNTNYNMVGYARDNGTDAGICTGTSSGNGSSKAVGSMQILTTTSAGSAQDDPEVGAAFFGDYA